jgi:hypothetical protein
VLVLECDGKGIVMRPGQMRPDWARKACKSAPKQDGRLSRGEVRNRKRMAETGAVFDITPAPRTPEDILPSPSSPGLPPAASKVTSKWVTASVARPTADVAASVFAEAGVATPGTSAPGSR